MRHFYWLIAFLILSQQALSQNIVRGERWVDTDPGVGNGVAVTTVQGLDSLVLLQNLTGISTVPGWHQLGFRFLNSLGLWSLSEYRSFFVFNVTFVPPVLNETINKAEYFLDNDPGYNLATPFPIGTPSDSLVFSAAASASALTPGWHRIGFRVRNASGKWSLNEIRDFYVFNISYTPAVFNNGLVEAEYFFDTDPGAGNATPLTISPGADSLVVSQAISAASLPNGAHTLNIRIKNASGKWSLTESRSFVVGNCGFSVSTNFPGGVASLCSGQNTTLSVQPNTGAYTYEWKKDGVPLGVNSPDLVAGTSGIYQVEVSATGCTLSSNFIQVQVESPTITITDTIGPTAFCFGADTTLLVASGSFQGTLQWVRDGAPIAGQISDSLMITSSGSYSVVLTSLGGCTVSSSEVQISSSNPPSASTTPVGQVSICSNELLSVTATPGSGLSYEWLFNGQPLGQSSNSVTISQAGSYQVEITNASGCSAVSSPLFVMTMPVPVAVLQQSGNAAVCPGISLPLTAQAAPGQTYHWYRNGVLLPSDSTAVFAASAAGSYFFVAENADGCRDTSSTLVLGIHPQASAALNYSGTVPFCSGTSLDLISTSSAIQSNTWINNGIATGISSDTVVVDTPGTWILAVSTAQGCTDTSAAVVFTAISQVVAEIANGASLQVCQNSNVTLVATNSSGFAVSWILNGSALVGQANDSLIQLITGTQPYNYQVVLTAGQSCVDTSSVTTILPFPTSPLAVFPSGIGLCQGETGLFRVLTAQLPNFSSFSWYALPGNPVGSADSLLVTSAGNYQVTGVDTNGCTSVSNIVNVAVTNDFGSLLILGDPQPFAGTNYQYFAQVQSASPTYAWQVTGGNIQGAANNSSVLVNWNNGASACSLKLTATVQFCSKDTTIQISLLGAEGRTETPFVLLAPNPSEGLFQLKIEYQQQPVTIQIYNAANVLVRNLELNASQSVLDCSQLASGIYFARITVKNEIYYQKLEIIR